MHARHHVDADEALEGVGHPCNLARLDVLEDGEMHEAPMTDAKAPLPVLKFRRQEDVAARARGCLHGAELLLLHHNRHSVDRDEKAIQV